MRNFFDSRPGYDATIFAEAQALADDGLDRDFVLGLFPDEAEWLGELLEFTGSVSDAIAADPPSYYFEASLKSRFLAAGREAAREPEPQPMFAFSRMRTFAATMSVGLAAVVVAVLTLGFVTAGSAVPGEWNYSFKLANERLQYTLSRGDSRVDIQFRQAEARVQEIRILSARGDVSASDIAALEREARALAELARSQPFDEGQRARQLGITMQGTAVLNNIRQKQPPLEPEVAAAAAALNDAATTAVALPPTPTSTAAATARATATPPVTASPSASAAAAPEATATPEPTATATPTTTPTATPAPAATPTPSPTAAPSQTATATPAATGAPSPAATSAP